MLYYLVGRTIKTVEQFYFIFINFSGIKKKKNHLFGSWNAAVVFFQDNCRICVFLFKITAAFHHEAVCWFCTGRCLQMTMCYDLVNDALIGNMRTENGHCTTDEWKTNLVSTVKSIFCVNRDLYALVMIWFGSFSTVVGTDEHAVQDVLVNAQTGIYTCFYILFL